MANRSAALRGSQVELSVVFRDAGNNNTDPSPSSSIVLSIYPPNHDPRFGDEESNAWVKDVTLLSSGTGPYATVGNFIRKLDTGRYTYTFSIPSDADLGVAFDRWRATVDLEELDETFVFVIAGGGSGIPDGGTQLYENNVVFITLDDTIADANGNTLEEPYEWYFTTTYNPLYSSVRRVRLDLGGMLSDVPDDTINLAIFEASLDADAFTFGTPSGTHMDFFEFARRQYVTCAAELILMGAIQGTGSLSGGKLKRLADLQVKLIGGTSALSNDLLKKINSCIVKWESVLTSSGEIGPGTSQRPIGVVKGRRDPDRPHIGRGWSEDSDIPALNDTVRPRGHRRWQKTFYPWGSRFK